MPPAGPTAAQQGGRRPLPPAHQAPVAGPLRSSSSRWRRARIGLWTRSRWGPSGRPLATPPPWRGRARRSEPAIVAGPAPCPLVEAEASCKVVKRNAAKWNQHISVRIIWKRLLESARFVISFQARAETLRLSSLSSTFQLLRKYNVQRH